MSTITPDQARQAERWFRSHGLVTMMQGTGLQSKLSLLAAPILVIDFIIVMLFVVTDSTDLPWWMGLLISFGTLLATWILSNVTNRRRPLTPISTVGPVEGAAFVLVPAVVTLFTPQRIDIDPDWQATGPEASALVALALLVIQAATLLAVYVLVISGIGSLSRLLWRELRHAVEHTSTALATTLPVMLGFVFFFFVNPGVWLVIANLDPWSYVALILLIVGLSGLFLGSRSQFDLTPLATFDTTEDVTDALRGTPLSDRADGIATPATCDLGVRQETNLRFVAVLARLVTATVLSLVVLAAFVVLGLIIINASVIETWTKAPPQVLFGFELGPTRHIVAVQHLRVAGFLAAFSGFQYALVSASDGRLRENARDTAKPIVRSACALRLALLSARSAAAPRAD